MTLPFALNAFAEKATVSIAVIEDSADAELQRIDGLSQTFTNLIQIPIPINIIQGSAFSTKYRFPVTGWHSLRPYRIGIVRGIVFAEQPTRGMNVTVAENYRELVDLLENDQVDVGIMPRIEGLEAIHFVKSALMIRERDANYRELVSTIPGVVYEAETDEFRTMREMSGSIKEITGREAGEFITDSELHYPSIVVSEDRALLNVTDEGPFSLDYRIERPDGSVRWVADHGAVTRHENGEVTRRGVILDITARKAAQAELEELHRKLGRYISPQVYNSIFQGHQDAQVGSTRKKLTIFFSDVVNFTMKSESLDPDDLSFIVNSYLNRMAEITAQNGGTLDKFIGDGVVVFSATRTHWASRKTPLPVRAWRWKCRTKSRFSMKQLLDTE